MYNYKAFVDRVVDGDTIDLTISLGFDIYIKERVRLFGVDTPETRTRNKSEKIAGLKAKAFVKDWIEGQEIEVTTEEKGKFGRYLAVIIIEVGGKKHNVNKTLVSNGLAKAYWGGKKVGWGE